jgi:hypothetical protein
MSYTFPVDPKAVWNPIDVVALLATKMPVDDWRIVTGVAVVLAESGGNPLALGTLVWNPGNPTHLAIDLGMFQLNSYYQTVVDPFPTISKIAWADTFDPFAAFEHVWKLINHTKKGWNYDWSSWTVYNTGAYDKFVSTAYKAVNDYRATLGKGPL